MEPLLSLADIVKVDFMQLTTEELIKLTQRLQHWKCALLAEKVETKTMYRLAKTLGYSYFQGYLLSKPTLIGGRTISAAEMSKVRLLKELNKDDIDLTRLSKIISNDVSLSYRLIKHLNSAYHGFLHKINSIQQAVILLGYLPLRHWLFMVFLSDLGVTTATREISFISVKRAKFLEFLAQELHASPAEQDSLFMLGLFSNLDSLMDLPMETLMASMPLDPLVKEALSEKDNELTPWLNMAIAIDDGEWSTATDLLASLGIDLERAAVLHAQAMRWAKAHFQVESSPSPPPENK